MPAFVLDHLSDETLLADLAALVATDRQTTAALLAHLAEVEARDLFRPAACSSMFAYCTRVLRLSDDAALKRIRAARVGRRHPQIFEAIADGRVHLTAVVLLAPHFTDDNVDELLAAATHRTKAEIDVLVARLAPQPDLPTSIAPIEPAGGSPGRAAGPEMVLEPPPAPVAPPATKMKPLSPQRFALQVTISQETRDKLVRAQALLSHRNPSGDLAAVIDRAVDALLVVLERGKFGKTSRPRAAKPRPADADPRYASNEVRREVHARDGEQCAFVSKDGVRCTERRFLELDHRTPVCLGGQPTAGEMRFYCHAHNQYAADERLGVDFMRAKRDQARAKRAEARAKRRADAVERPRPDAAERPSADPIERPSVDGAGPPAAGAPFDRDVTLALRGMGFAAAETRRAMEDTAQVPATTIEARLRAALAALTRAGGFRCSDGPFDRAVHRLHTLVSSA